MSLGAPKVSSRHRAFQRRWREAPPPSCMTEPAPSLRPPPQRTKAGAKLALPRPVNLPSLRKARLEGLAAGERRRSLLAPGAPPALPNQASATHLPQENASAEPAAGSSGTLGWSSGGGTAAAATDAGAQKHGADGPAGAQQSSLVEKASWAGQGRPAAPPSPWDHQPRGLNPREFPSLAAAAQQAATQPSHRGPTGPPAPEHGAWDEDERGGGPPGPSHDRGRSPRGYGPGPHARHDDDLHYRHGGGYGGAGGYYGRRPDYSPRRMGGEDGPGHGGRYGGPPPGREPPYHGGGYGDRYGERRDDGPPGPRDWNRHDRCVGLHQGQGHAAAAAGCACVACWPPC